MPYSTTPTTDELLTQAVRETTDLVKGMAGRQTALEQDYTELRALLRSGGAVGALTPMYGRTGAEDWAKTINDVVKAAVDLRIYHNPAAADKLGLVYTQSTTNKTAAPLETQTSARGGIAVPTTVMPGLQIIQNCYGQVLAACRQIACNPGQTMTIPTESLAPVPVYRHAQATEVTEMDQEYGSVTINPGLIGGRSRVSLELLHMPEVNFGAMCAEQIVRRVTERAEFGLLQGEDSGNAWPSDGLLIQSGTSSQTGLGGVSETLLITFIAESVEDYNGLDSGRAILITSPKKKWQFVGAAVAASAPLNSLFEGRERIASFAGIPMLASQGMLVSSTHYIALIDPTEVIVGCGPWYIDVSEGGEAFENFAADLRAVRHYDWCFPLPSRFSKATVA